MATSNSKLVTPAYGRRQRLSPLTFGSYLPPQFNSIMEEETEIEDDSNSDTSFHLEPYGGENGTKQKEKMETEIHKVETKEKNDNRSSQKGSVGNSKKALVSWAKVCTPKAAGGQNIMNLMIWNQAAILKQLWAVHCKKECLWIKWIHEYYMKGETIDTCTVPANATWVVRKIIESRSYIQSITSHNSTAAILDSMVEQGRFAIKKLYLFLLPQYQKVEWRSITLQQNVHPRHKFTVWLAAWGRLATVDRLQKFGIQVPMECVFCDDGIETLDHLFFACPITNRLWRRILLWLGINRQIEPWQEELRWACSWAKRRTGMAAIISSAFAMVVSVIWRSRNQIRFKAGTFQLEQVCREVAIHIHTRGRQLKKWQMALANLSSRKI